MPNEVSPANSNTKPERRSRIFPRRAYFFLLVGALAAAILYPVSFQWIIRMVLNLEAYRSGVQFEVTKIDGSVFEPVRLEGCRLGMTPPAGVEVEVRVDEIEAAFSARNLLFAGGKRFLDRLRLSNVYCTLRVIQEGEEEENASAPTRAEKGASLLKFLSPGITEGSGVNLTLREGPESFQVRNASFTIPAAEPGTIRIEEIAIFKDWIRRRFANVSGSTAFVDTKFTISNLTLAPGAEVTAFSADFGRISDGALELQLDLQAFDGSVRCGATAAPRGKRLNIEANGSFSQISIAKLAQFLDYPGDAGGVVKQGKFTFSGSPRNLRKATLWTWLEADNFQWGKRQWDSLRLGATLVNRRLQVNELRVLQGTNSIDLSGDLELPNGRAPWWKSDFRFDLTADIHNLTELSKLVDPEFGNVYGALVAEGSVRCSGEKLGGQLILTGSGISWRGAPLDSLQAAVKLSENELQIVNLEFSHAYDYARARGSVTVFGDLHYAGEIKASVDDLGLYDGILQPPLVPEAPAGGLNIEWSGDGTAKAHSGVFKARFKKLRPLISRETAMPPLDAGVEGSYSPGNVFLSRCDVSEGATSLSAQVAVAPASLQLSGIRLIQKKKTTLTGDAKVPVDLWSTWPGAKVDPDGNTNVNLKASDLALNDLLRLFGIRLPLDLNIDMQANGEGALSEVALSGSVRAKDALLYDFPGGTVRGDLRVGVTGTCGKASIEGVMQPTSVTTRGPLTLDAMLASNGMLPRVPSIQMPPFSNWTVAIESRTVQPLAVWGGTADADLALVGTAGGPTLVGVLKVNGLKTDAEHLTGGAASGTLWFAPENSMNPVLDILLAGNAPGFDVALYRFGSWTNPGHLTTTYPALTPEEADLLVLKGTAPAPSPTPAPSPSPDGSPSSTPTAPVPSLGGSAVGGPSLTGSAVSSPALSGSSLGIPSPGSPALSGT